MLHWLSTPDTKQKTFFGKNLNNREGFEKILTEKLNEFSNYNHGLATEIARLDNELNNMKPPGIEGKYKLL